MISRSCPGVLGEGGGLVRRQGEDLAAVLRPDLARGDDVLGAEVVGWRFRLGRFFQACCCATAPATTAARSPSRSPRKGRDLTLRIVPLAQLFERVALGGLNAARADALRSMLRRVYDNLAVLDSGE